MMHGAKLRMMNDARRKAPHDDSCLFNGHAIIVQYHAIIVQYYAIIVQFHAIIVQFYEIIV